MVFHWRQVSQEGQSQLAKVGCAGGVGWKMKLFFQKALEGSRFKMRFFHTHLGEFESEAKTFSVHL